MSYNTSTNRLSAIGSATPTYDAAGNLTADGVNTYAWNAENHLTSAAGVTYTYDGGLRRVKKSSGLLYWYGVDGNVLATSDLSGNLTSEWTFFDSRRIARRDASSGNVYYIFPDRLGSYRTLTDSTGNLKGESDYYLFGSERVFSSTVTDNFRFAGMEWDSEDGLNHTLYRQYTPVQGRWLSPDPKAGSGMNPQNHNRYAYVVNSPTNRVDPRGDQFAPAPGGCGDPYCCCSCSCAATCAECAIPWYCAPPSGGPPSGGGASGGGGNVRTLCTCKNGSGALRLTGCTYDCNCSDGASGEITFSCHFRDKNSLKRCPKELSGCYETRKGGEGDLLIGVHCNDFCNN